MAINTTAAAPSSICPFQLSWRASRVYPDASREATSSPWFLSFSCQRTPTVWLLSWHKGRSVVYLKKRRRRSATYGEVKTLKRKRQMEQNQTPCENRQPLYDGAVWLVCIDTITERRPETANTPWTPHSPQSQTHYFTRATSPVLTLRACVLYWLVSLYMDTLLRSPLGAPQLVSLPRFSKANVTACVRACVFALTAVSIARVLGTIGACLSDWSAGMMLVIILNRLAQIPASFTPGAFSRFSTW